jgi:phage tail-like protein
VATFSVNTQRFDPYKSYRFNLLDGTSVVQGTLASGLKTSGGVIDYRDGSDAPLQVRKLPGSSLPDITLKRGVVQDQSFSSWASKVAAYGASVGAEVSLANFRKNVLLEFFDEAGQQVSNYRIFRSAVLETPLHPRGGLIWHALAPHGPRSLQEQLAEIFEKSLRRLRPRS